MSEPKVSPLPPSVLESLNEWKKALAILTTAYLLLEAVTGIAVHLMPFGTFPQTALLVHTLIGVAFLPFYVVYQWKHWRRLQPRPVTHLKVVGYVLLLVLLANLVTGFELTIEAIFGRRLAYLADRIHLVTGYAVAVLLVTHLAVVMIVHRQLAARIGPEAVTLARAPLAHAGRAALICTGLIVLTGVAAKLAPNPDASWSLPEGYTFPYGPNPYAPSLATTADGRPINPAALARSRSCGTNGCHEEIVAEWTPSAHRYASMDVAFQAIQHTMAENEGPESTRYCAGCHDPIALFSGSKNLYDKDLSSFGADEGVSCIGCHSITKTDVRGNANYVLEAPARYLFEYADGSIGRLVSDFLIRSYPEKHVASYKRDLYKTPEFCGACHKQFIDKEINKATWVQLQNQYDNWKASHWNQGSGPESRITCMECHMRLVDSVDPAAGDARDYNRTVADGKHRHHGFIGSNQFIPKVQNLEGWERQVALTEEWLRGDTELPEIAPKFRKGPAVPIRIDIAKSIDPAEPFSFRIGIHSNKVGHDFPTGPLDVIQCWLEVSVTDRDGREIYASGGLDDKNFVEEGSFSFKAEGIDRHGNLIDRHNLWDMVGARFRRALFPDYTDTVKYQVFCPETSKRADDGKRLPEETTHSVAADPGGFRGPLTVKAKLNYRKINQFLLNYLMGRTDLTTPVTVMSTAEATVDVKASN